jgi:hypothetical protein
MTKRAENGAADERQTGGVMGRFEDVKGFTKCGGTKGESPSSSRTGNRDREKQPAGGVKHGSFATGGAVPRRIPPVVPGADPVLLSGLEARLLIDMDTERSRTRSVLVVQAVCA